ncbi:MAG: hypothetical protein HC851_16365 [Acaryochloris sp. RU_4_1]|nr:hypothetical protein [Acaryochloris sp. RU_4_1]NJR56124.1 hypothetical protein [Acaryochloris sp. CRU_2_0]
MATIEAPLLLISILMHGALLATPLPQSSTVETTQIKDIPTTKTVSLKRTKAKPKRQPKFQLKLNSPASQTLLSSRPTSQPRPVSQSSRQKLEVPKPQKVSSPTKATAPQIPPSNTTTSQSIDLKNPNPKPIDPATEEAPIDNTEVETIFGELDQALINTKLESNYEYIPSPREFPEPEKFFTPASIQAFDIVSNPNLVASGGIINSPRYYRLKDPDAVLASLPGIPAFQTAGKPKQIGQYGGGPVYAINLGTKTYYINLVKAKSMSKATFVVFWRWDPNNPPQQ